MKISASILLLVLSSSDAFIGPSPSKATSSLQGSQTWSPDDPQHVNDFAKTYTGGIEASSIMGGRIDVDNAWGNSRKNRLANVGAGHLHPVTRPTATAAAVNRDYNSPHLVNGGIGGSKLVREPINPDSAFSDTYYQLQGINTRRAAPPPPAAAAAPVVPPPVPEVVENPTVQAAVPMPETVAAPVAEAVGANPNPTFPPQ